MAENSNMEWNMEWKIFSMEWKKIFSIEYGKTVFHFIPYHALVTGTIMRRIGINLLDEVNGSADNKLRGTVPDPVF